MLITLVFIEHNCTFNLVRTLALKVIHVLCLWVVAISLRASHEEPLPYMLCGDLEPGTISTL